MRFKDRYPIVVTAAKDACRDFWSRHLGLRPVFESSWFVLMMARDGSCSIGFMSPDHPSAPPGPDVFSGKGLCFELEVEDVTAFHDRAVAGGLAVDYPLTDEPFGQRRFGFHDPAGLWIDVVEQTEPEPGYWDRFAASTA